jgi:hypothetical protein
VFPDIGGAIGFVDDPVAVVGPVVVGGGVVVGGVVVGGGVAVVGGAIAVIERMQRAMAAPNTPMRRSIVDPNLITRQRPRTEPPERLLPENHRRPDLRYRVQWDRS